MSDEARDRARAAIEKIEAWARGKSLAPSAADVVEVRRRLETLEEIATKHNESRAVTRRDQAAWAAAGHALAHGLATSGEGNPVSASEVAAMGYVVADEMERVRRQ